MRKSNFAPASTAFLSAFLSGIGALALRSILRLAFAVGKSAHGVGSLASALFGRTHFSVMMSIVFSGSTAAPIG